MGATQLAMRLLGSIARVDQHKMRTGRLNDEEWSRLSTAMGKLHDAPIFMRDRGAESLELRTRARRIHRQCGKLGLVMVDYLQLMSAPSSSQGENRATEIFRDFALAQGARQGTERAGGGAVAAQPGARDAQRQAADDVGPARVGRHRAGRGPEPCVLPEEGQVDLPIGPFRCLPMITSAVPLGSGRGVT